MIGGFLLQVKPRFGLRRIKVPTSSISYKKEPADDSSSTGLSA